MANLSKATPRPWRANGGILPRVCAVVDGKSVTVAGAHKIGRGNGGQEIAEANAALIVKAVNEREGLIAALRNAANELKAQAAILAELGVVRVSSNLACDYARTALTKAKAP